MSGKKVVLWLTLITSIQALLLIWFMSPALGGPDLRKYAEIAALATNNEYWVDPRAFDGNYWPVGYPMFLSVIFRFLGPETGPIQWIQLILGLSFPTLAYLVARHSGRRVGLLVAFLVAINPATISMIGNGGYEILLGLLITLSTAILFQARIPKGKARLNAIASGLIAGLAMGFAILAQNKAIVLVPILGYLAFKISSTKLIAFLVGVGIPVCAWSLRNLLVLGTFSPFGTNSAINAWIGTNPTATNGGFMEPPPLPEGSESYWMAVIDQWLYQPEASILLLFRRFARLLSPEFIYPDIALPAGYSTLIHFFSAAITISILIPILAYTFGRIWSAPPVLPAVGALACMWWVFALVHLPFLTETRYMGPLVPIATAIAVPTFLLASKRFQEVLRKHTLMRRGNRARTQETGSALELDQ